MIITLFGETIVKPGKEDEEALLSDKLDPILRSMPGFISFKSYQADDGEEIGIIRFESREALTRGATKVCTVRPRRSRIRSTSDSGYRARKPSASTRGTGATRLPAT